ncbi:MAG: metal-dependent hydrolase [Patescibacteria group bacterium]
MMSSTHQLMALLSAFWVLTQYPVSVGPVMAVLAIVAVMVGALTPDLDQPTANVWRRVLGARALGNIFQSFSGGHRHFTHSVIGILVVGYALRWGIHHFLRPELIDEAMIIWRAYMIGYISHPIADTLTDNGVPWLWPLHIQIKVPPGPEELRVTTDSIVERVVVRGGVIISIVLIVRSHWDIFLNLFR